MNISDKRQKKGARWHLPCNHNTTIHTGFSHFASVVFFIYICWFPTNDPVFILASSYHPEPLCYCPLNPFPAQQEPSRLPIYRHLISWCQLIVISNRHLLVLRTGLSVHLCTSALRSARTLPCWRCTLSLGCQILQEIHATWTITKLVWGGVISELWRNETLRPGFTGRA